MTPFGTPLSSVAPSAELTNPPPPPPPHQKLAAYAMQAFKLIVAISIEKHMTLAESTGPLGIWSIPTDKTLTVLGPAQRRCMHSSCAKAATAFTPYSTKPAFQGLSAGLKQKCICWKAVLLIHLPLAGVDYCSGHFQQQLSHTGWWQGT